MFDVEYKGGNCVVIATKNLRLVTDPRLSAVGLKDIQVKDAVEVVTEPRFMVDEPEARLVIDGPGEYEIGDFSIRGVSPVNHVDIGPTGQASNIYRVEVNDVRIALLGNITDSLSEDQLESIGVVDMVIMPIGGGGYTLDPENAARIVRQLDPKAVIPVHYKEDGIAYEAQQGTLSDFVRELSAPLETVDKYKVKSAAVLPVSLTIIEVKRS